MPIEDRVGVIIHLQPPHTTIFRLFFRGHASDLTETHMETDDEFILWRWVRNNTDLEYVAQCFQGVTAHQVVTSFLSGVGTVQKS